MGRDERKRLGSLSLSPSPSREEEKRKRRKTHKTDERETSSKSEGMKRSRDSEETHKSSRHDKKEKKRKSKDKEKIQNLDSFEEISKDDYFKKNNEFSTWLKEEKGKFFSELTSETAREMFLGFVKQWNRKRLDRRYYEGIVRGPRSDHSWKIKK